MNPSVASTRRNIDAISARALADRSGSGKGAVVLSVVIKPMQQVRQRLGVHQAVFDRHTEHERVGGLLKAFIDCCTEVRVVTLNFRYRRPIFG